MKSLDEVIESMELISDVNMPYRVEHADALHYLKGYRIVTDICNRHGIASVFGQMLPDPEKTDRDKKINFDNAYDNDPLTWDELQQMEGKPVYIIESTIDFDDIGIKRTGHWDIIRKVYPEMIAFYVHGMTYHKSWQGIGWQAFRKERE